MIRPTLPMLTAAVLLCGAIGCQSSAPSITPHECRQITARTFKVQRVVDGDTFKITYDGEPTSVRIAGIDAPERRDAEGRAATAALRKLIEGKVVRIEFTGERKRDNFGRLLGRSKVAGDMTMAVFSFLYRILRRVAWGKVVKEAVKAGAAREAVRRLGQPGRKTLRKQLRKLDKMKANGEIDEGEYAKLREKAIKECSTEDL